MKHESMCSIVGLNINGRDTNFPTGLAWGRIANCDVAACGDECPINSPSLQYFECFVCRESFADSAQIETHIWQRQCCGARARIEAQVFPTDGCPRGGK